MKQVLLCLVVFLLPLRVFSQGITLTGKVVGEDGQPIPFASLMLMKDTAMLAEKISDENGGFTLEAPAVGTFLLVISHVSYSQLTQTVQVPQQGVTLTLHPQKELSGVTVTAKKPFVQRKIDRVVMNVQDNAIAAGKSSMDLFRMAPGVVVNNGAIAINGVWGARVMVNGRMLNLQGVDLKNYLANLKSSDIKSVEIIAHPPAEYDAEGTGGIINIVLKKNSNSGLSGTLGGDYSIGIGRYATYQPYGSLAYHHNKLSLSGSYAYNRSMEFEDITQDRGFKESGQYHSQDNSISRRSNNTVRLGGTYDISDKQSISIDYTGQFGWFKDTSLSTSTITYPDHTQDTHAAGVFPAFIKTNFTNVGLNYNITTDTMGSKFTLVADYTHNDRQGSSGVNSWNYNAVWTIVSDTAYQFHYPSLANILTADAKYVKAFKHGTALTLGGKATVTSIDNTNAYDFFEQGKWTQQPELNFDYQYREKIYAGYLNLGGHAAGVEYSLGLRGENSDVSGRLTGGQDTLVQRNYFNLFPAVFVSKKFNEEKGNSLSFSYNRRIKRPSYFELNPYRFYIDSYTSRTGNPFLNPQFTDAVELGYTLHSRYYFSASYAHTKDVINLLVEASASTGQTTVIYRNSGSSTVYTGTISIPVAITSWWNTTNNLLLTYTQSKGPQFDIQKASFVFQTEQDIQLQHGFGVNLSAFYAPNVVQGNIVTASMSSVDIGVQKKLLKDKLTAKAALSDIFYGNNLRATTYYYDDVIHIRQLRQTRVLTLSLLYNFKMGKAFNVRQVKRSNTDEKSRLN